MAAFWRTFHHDGGGACHPFHYIYHHVQSCLVYAPAERADTTELQLLLSGVHSIMRVKLAHAGKGARPPPFITFTITSKVAAYAPAEWADTLTLFHV
jgi:hypothetical protein